MRKLKNSFSSLCALILRLKEDSGQSEEELRLRDSQIDSSEIDKGKGELGRVLAWLKIVDNERVSNFRARENLFYFCLMIAGFAFGGLTSSVVFSYSGVVPINIFLVLIVLVLIPLILLGFNLLLCLPISTLSRIPFLGNLSLALFSLNPVSRLFSKFLRIKSESKETLFSPAFNETRKWYFISSSQLFGVNFFLGVLVHYVYLVAFSDLAFGWSSTLDISAEAVFSFTSMLAYPWAEIYHYATPKLEIVELTRFYRIDGAEQVKMGASIYGAWWEFILMVIIAYGLMPRLLFLFILLYVKDEKIKKAHLLVPGVKQVLWRLNSEQANFEVTRGESDIQESGLVDVPRLALPKDTVFVSWGFETTASQLKSLGFSSEEFEGKNLYLSLREANSESSVLEKLQGINKKAICVFVRSWEVPMEEIFDFLRNVESQAEREVELILVPVNPKNKLQFEKATEREEQVWARKIKNLDNSNWLIRTHQKGSHV